MRSPPFPGHEGFVHPLPVRRRGLHLPAGSLPPLLQRGHEPPDPQPQHQPHAGRKGAALPAGSWLPPGAAPADFGVGHEAAGLRPMLLGHPVGFSSQRGCDWRVLVLVTGGIWGFQKNLSVGTASVASTGPGAGVSAGKIHAGQQEKLPRGPDQRPGELLGDLFLAQLLSQLPGDTWGRAVRALWHRSQS